MGVTEKAVLYSLSRFSWELGEVGAAKPDGARLLREAPAAFGRLCVETKSKVSSAVQTNPAAFGRLCVETLNFKEFKVFDKPAAFGRLCVETRPLCISTSASGQPPSGGCVLKPCLCGQGCLLGVPAAFRRLCVEILKWRENVLAAVY